jgi:tripartite-type tricarboxylate transporter receptor subunit TctC
MPDVPSLGEANVHAVDADTWFGIYAPVGLPRDIAVRLNAEIARIVRTPQAVDRFTAGGAEGAVMSAAEFGALQRSESKRFGAIVRAANIKVD